MRVTTALLAISATLMIGCGQAAAPNAPPKAGAGGYAAPDFTVETFSGESFNLVEQKGTPVVLNFWESW